MFKYIVDWWCLWIGIVLVLNLFKNNFFDVIIRFIIYLLYNSMFKVYLYVVFKLF